MSFRQVDDLFIGIAEGGSDMLKGIINSPKAILELGKELIFGDLTLKEVGSIGIDALTSDYKYLWNNKNVLSFKSKVSDAQVRAYGSHITGVLVDITATVTAGGAGAAKLTEVLSKTKSGTRVLEAMEGVCFTEDTLIYTRGGYKPIKDIQVGDEVYSENPETGEKGLKEVKDLHINETDSLTYVYAGKEEIKTTPSHPFWVVGKGWVEAASLKAGDKLLMYDGNVLKVKELKKKQLSEPFKVYNFEVEDWHTYFVSEQNVLVHNSCKIVANLGKSYGKFETVVENPGIKITSFSQHGVNQAITRGATTGIIKSTINNPTVVLSQRGGSVFAYVSDDAVVVVDKTGKVITTYGKDYFDATVKRILKEAKQ